MRPALRPLLLIGTGLCVLPARGWARPAAPGTAPRATIAPVSRDQPVTFTADRVEYDRERGTVTASGDVEAWQNDHVMRADRITYDRNTNVLAATGHVAIVEPDGETLFSDYAELTKGMRDGVLRGMRAVLAENGKLAANGARRTDGKVNELSHAVYSTCDLCKDDPSRPPLWQLRAYSAVQDKEHQTIEYQDAFLDVFGVPVAYLPWFSHADPSVKRQTGLLIPSFGRSKHLGEFVSAPYYQVIDPQSDVVLTPTVTSRGTGNLDALYRRRFNDGTVTVNTSLGYEPNTRSSSSEGRTVGGAEGALFARGQFALDDTWRYGFDLQGTTARDYLRDYRLPNVDQVLTSQVYLEGFGVGSYARLDARGYQALNDTVSQDRLPYVLPRYEYSYFGETDPLGGRVSVDTSLFNVYRETGTRTQRGALTADYARPFTDALGQRASVDLHLDAAAYNADDLNQQPNHGPAGSADAARAQPQVALNYAWPLLRQGMGTQTIEPIAQFIAAPQVGNSRNRFVPNEDSLDFEYSDANLFAFNRHPGLDRLEGGERANYAMHGNWTGDNGAALDALVGQSYRLGHDDGTYPLGSGLASNLSDVVGRVSVTPAKWFDLTYRTRLNHNDFTTRMADGVATVGVPAFKVSAGYAYDAVNPYFLYDTPTVPASYFVPRNELTLGASSQVGDYRVGAFVRRDLKNNGFVSLGGNAAYEDECFILSANLYRRYTSIDNDHGDTTVLFQVTFKTVGQVGYHAF